MVEIANAEKGKDGDVNIQGQYYVSRLKRERTLTSLAWPAFAQHCLINATREVEGEPKKLEAFSGISTSLASALPAG